jgi:DNA-binding MarR family transcriptional regulator
LEAHLRIGILRSTGDSVRQLWQKRFGQPHRFNTLKSKLATTDGTLSVHLRKLEEAGYILVDKGYNGRRPVTRLSLSAKGRKAFQAYLAAMARLADLSEG